MKIKPPPSLLGRIFLRLALTTLAAIIAAYGWLWWEFQSTTSALRDQSLIESSRVIANAVKAAAAGNLELQLSQSMLDAYAESDGKHGFAVRDRVTGAVLFAAGINPGPIPSQLKDDEDGTLYQYNPDGPGPTTYFGEALPFERAGRHLVVQVVRSGSDYQELIETVLADFFEDGGWLAGPFLLVLLLVSSLTVRGTLAPLRTLSRRAEQIGPRAADLRLPMEDIPKEVVLLVSAVNRALARLEEGYRIEREFTADAAHELRTPLAVLTAHIDTLADRAVAQALRRDVDSMTHIVEQLLRSARAEALVIAPNDQTELGNLARDVAAYLAPMAIRMGRTIEVEAPEQTVLVKGQSDALFHAVRNLVENGLRYTPENSAVVLRVEMAPPALIVRDSGPGIPAHMRAAVFRRFWRPDRRTDGAGLGLAIVQRTMQAHDGSVTIEDAPGGGAQFRLTFMPA